MRSGTTTATMCDCRVRRFRATWFGRYPSVRIGVHGRWRGSLRRRCRLPDSTCETVVGLTPAQSRDLRDRHAGLSRTRSGVSLSSYAHRFLAAAWEPRLGSSEPLTRIVDVRSAAVRIVAIPANRFGLPSVVPPHPEERFADGERRDADLVERYTVDALLARRSASRVMRPRLRRIAVHWHDFYELCFVVDGEADATS